MKKLRNFLKKAANLLASCWKGLWLNGHNPWVNALRIRLFIEQKRPNVTQELSNEKMSNKSPTDSDSAKLSPVREDSTEMTPCGNSTTTNSTIIIWNTLWFSGAHYPTKHKHVDVVLSIQWIEMHPLFVLFCFSQFFSVLFAFGQMRNSLW